MIDLTTLRHPVIAAPMAGGPSTPELAAAVSAAGGLGFLAAGYQSPEALKQQIEAVRAKTDAPFGVNVFVPDDTPVDEAAVQSYAELLAPEAARRQVTLGAARGADDNFATRVALLRAARVPIVSFTFGLPPREVVDALHEAGSGVLVTVTTPQEASAAQAVGADGLVVQGVEAGGHRGGHADADGIGEYGLLALVRLVARTTRRPIVAAGGIADGAGVAAVLAAGAVAAQLGTAFLRCPETGTNAVHRAALGTPAPTALTRAFTGRRARSIVNDFMRRYSAAAPTAYPHVHHLTAPLRAAARSAGDAESTNLWAGQAHQLAEELPAGELVRRLGDEARATLTATARRYAADA